ncbi:hypothetical protein [Paraburkholderia caribensis]|nr:hypothetical protein [Paraburkholderia caribensis]
MTETMAQTITLNHVEALRSPETAADADPRTSMFAGQTPISLAAHHGDIAAVQISANVPEKVAIQFETARNLYLYAWHVYRFFPVAQRQALSTLEFGLRSRFPGRLPSQYQSSRNKHPMLAGLLRYAIDQGFIRNEDFSRWHQVVQNRARERRSMESFRYMVDKQIDCMQFDENEPVSVTAEDQQWDLVQVLRDSLPALRNELSHGSTFLTNQVLGTIEVVGEILSQIYAPDREAAPTNLDVTGSR